MKTTIILHNDIKQIIFTPENDTEKQALKMITPNDNISLAIKEGTFYSSYQNKTPFSVNVNMCQGDYLRAWTDTDSIMLVLTPNEVDK